MTIQSQNTKVVYSTYNVPGTSFVYNSSGGTAATSGWIDVRNDHVLVQTCVATIGRSGSVIQRIEGKFSSLDRAASIDVKVISTKDTIDRLIQIDEKLREIRIGVKTSVAPSSPLASPLIFYGGICKTDIN